MALELTTERLVLREWRSDDYDAVKSFFASPENARFVGGTKSSEEAWRVMATYIGHHQLLGYSYMAVVEKATGQFVGSVGLWNAPSWPEPELGYWFMPEGQGKGYAHEAAAVLKQHALDTLKFESLVSFIASENEPSKKLALKLGAKQDGVIELFDFGPHEVYRYK